MTIAASVQLGAGDGDRNFRLRTLDQRAESSAPGRSVVTWNGGTPNPSTRYRPHGSTSVSGVTAAPCGVRSVKVRAPASTSADTAESAATRPYQLYEPLIESKCPARRTDTGSTSSPLTISAAPSYPSSRPVMPAASEPRRAVAGRPVRA